MSIFSIDDEIKKLAARIEHLAARIEVSLDKADAVVEQGTALIVELRVELAAVKRGREALAIQQVAEDK